MKKRNVLFFLCFLFKSNLHFAQTTGDFRTAQSSVSFSNSAHWQTWNGAQWVAASSIPASTNNVFIQAGHTVTLGANSSCNSLFISTGEASATSGAEGVLALQSNTLNLHGKLCCYFGSIDLTLNSTASLSITPTTSVHNLIITKSSGGMLKFVGSSRDLTSSGEWGSSSNGSNSLFDLEIALDANQTGTFGTSVKAANWIFSSGITQMGAFRISADNGTSGQGDVTIGSAATLVSSASSSANSVISRTGTSSTGRSGNLVINGHLQLSGSSPYIECSSISMGSSGVVELNRNGSQNFINSSFSGAATLLNYGKLKLSGTGNKTTLASLSTGIAANGQLIMAGGNLVIGSGGNFTVSSVNTTLEYSAASSQSASSTEWSNNFQNLIINNASGVSLGFGRTIEGSLTLSAGTFTINNHLSLGNTCTINKTGGNLSHSPNFGTSVNLNYDNYSAPVNSGYEIPTSNTILNNLVINNSNGLILNAAATVNGTLTLNLGKIISSSSALLTLSTSASVTGMTDSSFVNGPMAKQTNSSNAFVFPIGKGNYLRPLSVQPSDGNSNTYKAEYFNTTHANVTSLISPVSKVSSVDYFNIEQVAGSSTAIIGLSWNSNNGVETSSVSDLIIGRYNGTDWAGVNATGSGNANSGTLVSNSSQSQFGDFSLANGANNTNPLPVKFVFVKIIKSENNQLLKWVTASETHCKFFEIEAAEDGINFKTIGRVLSKSENGFSNSQLSYSFELPNQIVPKCFYRIKQIDFDGQSSYSNLCISKNLSPYHYRMQGQSLLVFPSENEPIQIELFTANGKVVLREKYYQSTKLDFSCFPNGLYYIFIDNAFWTKYLNGN